MNISKLSLLFRNWSTLVYKTFIESKVNTDLESKSDSGLGTLISYRGRLISGIHRYASSVSTILRELCTKWSGNDRTIPNNQVGLISS